MKMLQPIKERMNMLKPTIAILFLFAMVLVGSFTASAREIKIALDCPPDASKCGTYLWSLTFSEYLQSQGLQVKLFQRDALGGEAEKLDQVSQDLLEISNSDLAKAGSLDPTIFGFRLPFLIDDVDHLSRIIQNTDILETINARTTPKHVRVLAIVPLGAFHGFSTTKKIIKTPADFEGIRMRALDRSQAKWLELWGASSVVIPWAEIYNSLETGVCDGYMNGANVPLMFKHTDVIKYFSSVNLAPTLRTILVSEDWFQGLSQEERSIVDAGVMKANEAVLQWAKQSNQADLDELQAAGVTVYVNTPEEREAFAELIRPNYNEIVEPEVAELFIQLATEQKGGSQK